MTGSSLPFRASSVRSFAYFLRAWYLSSAPWSATRLDAADVLERREDRRLGEAEREERLRGGGTAVPEEREEQVLGGDVVVLEVGGDLLGEVEEPHERRREARFGVFAGDVRELRESLRDLLRGLARGDTHALEKRRDDSTFLFDEGRREVLGRHLRVAVGPGGLCRPLKDFLRLVGEAVGVHDAKKTSI